jgi:hypothetical protein
MLPITNTAALVHHLVLLAPILLGQMLEAAPSKGSITRTPTVISGPVSQSMHLTTLTTQKSNTFKPHTNNQQQQQHADGKGMDTYQKSKLALKAAIVVPLGALVAAATVTGVQNSRKKEEARERLERLQEERINATTSTIKGMHEGVRGVSAKVVDLFPQVPAAGVAARR